MQAELSERLANERPRNHLDVRHRLDKDGKRFGKVIDFAISELRAVEIIEDICEEMGKYQLEGMIDARGDDDDDDDAEIQGQQWVLSTTVLKDHVVDESENETDNTAASTAAAEAEAAAPRETSIHVIKEQRRLLRNACSGIIGEFEDELAEAIKEGEASAETVRDVLCSKFSGYCAVDDSVVDKGRLFDEL